MAHGLREQAISPPITVLNTLLLASLLGFPGGTTVKNLPDNAGDTRDVGSIPGSGRSPGVGNGNPLQNSWLGNPSLEEK